jgi:hypothetical protein
MILGAFHFSSILNFDIAIISAFGLISGLFGFLRPYPAMVFLSILISGFLVLDYAIMDGDIFSIILISTIIVAFYYSQHFLGFASRIILGIKGKENARSSRDVVKGFAFRILVISALAVLLSFILLNVSVYSSMGFTSVWTVLVLAILFISLAGLLIILPREKAG